MSDDVRVLTVTQWVSCRAGTAIPSRTPEFTPSF